MIKDKTAVVLLQRTDSPTAFKLEVNGQDISNVTTHVTMNAYAGRLPMVMVETVPMHIDFFDKDYCGRFREFNEAYYRTAAELVRCLTREKKDLRAMWFNGMLFGRFEEIVVGGYYFYVLRPGQRGGGSAEN